MPDTDFEKDQWDDIILEDPTAFIVMTKLREKYINDAIYKTDSCTPLVIKDTAGRDRWDFVMERLLASGIVGYKLTDLYIYCNYNIDDVYILINNFVEGNISYRMIYNIF